MNLPKPLKTLEKQNPLGTFGRGRKHKFNAVSSHCAQGHFHASTGESRRCDTLHLYQKAKEIKGLEIHPTIELVQGMKYKPDFLYFEDGKRIYEDFKGVSTDRFRIICKLWSFHGTGTLRISGDKKANRDIAGIRA